MPRDRFNRKPLFAGKNGGGGNRTRVGVTAETPRVQDFRRRAASCWREEQAWIWQLRADIWKHRDQLERVGDETWLYAVAAPDAVKIGVARDPIARWKHLQVSNPTELTLYAAVPATVALERFLHDRIRDHQIRGEWFALARPVLALMEELYGVAEILAGVQEHDDQHVDSVDTLLVFIDRVEDALRGLPEAA